MTLTRSGWRRVSKSLPCPVCGTADYCTFTDDGTVFKCMRRESSHPVKGGGYLHRAEDVGATPAKVAARAKGQKSTPKLTKAALLERLKRNRAAVDPRRLGLLAKDLGVTVRALEAYSVGWDSDAGCWSFPMYDGTRGGDGKLNPCGIRLRNPNYQPGGRRKKYFAVEGSSEGLLLPADYDAKEIPAEMTDDPRPMLLVMPEGPTCCAAAFDLGFRAAGRPSCAGGADQCRKLLSWGDEQEVIILADRDETKWLRDAHGKPVEPFWPGWQGAVGLADRLLGERHVLRFCLPPKPHKDLREWARAGVSALEIAWHLRAAPKVTRPWLRAAKLFLAERKAEEIRKARVA